MFLHEAHYLQHPSVLVMQHTAGQKRGREEGQHVVFDWSQAHCFLSGGAKQKGIQRVEFQVRMEKSLGKCIFSNFSGLYNMRPCG